MWRPKGWVNPNEEYYNVCDVPTVQDAEYEAYEAGADAMLKALITKPYKVIEWNCYVCGSERLVCDNCLVNRKFSPIPDEESLNE